MALWDRDSGNGAVARALVDALDRARVEAGAAPLQVRDRLLAVQLVLLHVAAREYDEHGRGGDPPGKSALASRKVDGAWVAPTDSSAATVPTASSPAEL